MLTLIAQGRLSFQKKGTKRMNEAWIMIETLRNFIRKAKQLEVLIGEDIRLSTKFTIALEIRLKIGDRVLAKNKAAEGELEFGDRLNQWNEEVQKVAKEYKSYLAGLKLDESIKSE